MYHLVFYTSERVRFSDAQNSFYDKVNCFLLVNDRNGISPEPDRNRNMDFLPNRNRTGTETHYRNISINIFSDLRICKEFLINILKITADFL